MLYSRFCAVSTKRNKCLQYTVWLQTQLYVYVWELTQKVTFPQYSVPVRLVIFQCTVYNIRWEPCSIKAQFSWLQKVLLSLGSTDWNITAIGGVVCTRAIPSNSNEMWCWKQSKTSVFNWDNICMKETKWENLVSRINGNDLTITCNLTHFLFTSSR